MTLRLRSQFASVPSLRVYGEPFDVAQDGSKGGECIEPRAKRVEP